MDITEYNKNLSARLDKPRCGVSVPEGWQTLVSTLVDDLESLPDDLEMCVGQIKEKFGGLRFYVDFKGNERSKRIAEALVAQAERKSNYTCVDCGEHGYVREDLRWVEPYCKECYAKVPAERKREVKQAIVIDETGVSLINEQE